MGVNKKNRDKNDDLAETFALKLEEKLKKAKKKEKLDNEDFNNWLLFEDFFDNDISINTTDSE